MISPHFDKDLRRGFQVHENCFDCANLYAGCIGWRGSRDFSCWSYDRLPDVLPGTEGQTFPSVHRQAPTHPAIGPLQQPQTADPPAFRAPLRDSTAIHPGRSGKSAARVCGCGTPLSKGKRLCDECRVEHRRQTKRQYMQAYMAQRRSGAVGSVSDVPSPGPGRPVTQRSTDDLPPRGLR